MVAALKQPDKTGRRAPRVNLKHLLYEAANRPLENIDPSLPHSVFTEASEYSSAAVLARNDANGVHRPIAFASAKLTTVQQRWASILSDKCMRFYGFFKCLIFGFSDPP